VNGSLGMMHLTRQSNGGWAQKKKDNGIKKIRAAPMRHAGDQVSSQLGKGCPHRHILAMSQTRSAAD